MIDFHFSVLLNLLQFLNWQTFKSTKEDLAGSGFCRRLTPSALGRGWPLIPRVRNGECVDRRLSHSLGLCSGTASIKFLFSSLILAWCFSKSSLGLSNSYMEQRGEENARGVVVQGSGHQEVWHGQVHQGNNKGRKSKYWKKIVKVGRGGKGKARDIFREIKTNKQERIKKEMSDYAYFCCLCRICFDLLQIR